MASPPLPARYFYVVATGQAHSVRDFLELAFVTLGLDNRDHVGFAPRFVRPSELDVLIGDASTLCDRLGWRLKVDFPGLVRMMIEHDLSEATATAATAHRGRS